MCILYIDTNKKKGPKIFGRDVHGVFITKNIAPLIYPMGAMEDDFNGTGVTEVDRCWIYNKGNRCSDLKSKRGRYCTGEIIEKGWVTGY